MQAQSRVVRDGIGLRPQVRLLCLHLATLVPSTAPLTDVTTTRSSDSANTVGGGMEGGAVLDLHRLLEEHGGLLATHELYAHGFTRGGVASLVRRGVLRRVRQGWFARPDLAREAVHATRIGGVISCATALRAHGIWAVDDHRLHVLVGHGASRLRTPGDPRRRLTERPTSNVRVHWAIKTQQREPTYGIAGRRSDRSA